MVSYPALELRFLPGPIASSDPATLQELALAAVDDYAPVAAEEDEERTILRIFFRTWPMRDAARQALVSALGQALVSVEPVDVPDEGWARRSQAGLRAIRVGGLIVAPPWDVPVNPDVPVIVIEPSTGFGTGHHATTRLCLSAMQAHDLRGRAVVDVGTGSGLLAIAARVLGASRVTAIDNDPDALRNARENLARNAIADEVVLVEADLGTLPPLAPADVMVANLTGAILQRHASALETLVRPGGVLILSGFAPDEIDDVVNAFRRPPAHQTVEGDWAAVTLVSG